MKTINMADNEEQQFIVNLENAAQIMLVNRTKIIPFTKSSLFNLIPLPVVQRTRNGSRTKDRAPVISLLGRPHALVADSLGG